MPQQMKVGVWFYGLGTALAGILNIAWGGFDASHQPIQSLGKNLPGQHMLAYIAGVWLVAAGHVTFQTGDALHLPFGDASFDAVLLQHVAMNIEDRAALYAEVRRILVPGGRFATYDVVLQNGDVVYPTPWARDSSTSFLLSEGQTRSTLEEAGFTAVLWHDDKKATLDWFKAIMAGPPPNGLSLGVVMGPEFQARTGNLARNIGENRLGVLSSALARRRNQLIAKSRTTTTFPPSCHSPIAFARVRLWSTWCGRIRCCLY